MCGTIPVMMIGSYPTHRVQPSPSIEPRKMDILAFKNYPQKIVVLDYGIHIKKDAGLQLSLRFVHIIIHPQAHPHYRTHPTCTSLPLLASPSSLLHMEPRRRSSALRWSSSLWAKKTENQKPNRNNRNRNQKNWFLRFLVLRN